MDRPAAPIDTAVLRTLRDRLQTHRLVETVRTEPTDNPISQIVVTLDADRYPSQIATVRLEIQWYKNDDYNFHYIETENDDTVWQCRWDRHPNPHTSRTHFHPPPAANSADAISDKPANRQPAAMLTRTLAAISDRIDDHWS